jgi:hypothetical protein
VYFGPEERVRVMVSGAFVGHTDYAARELRKESYGATVQMQVAW